MRRRGEGGMVEGDGEENRNRRNGDGKAKEGRE